MENKKIYFNVLTGKLHETNEEATELQKNFIVPLLRKPKESCKKCYGRGYIGYHKQMKYYHICPCIRNHVDFDAVKKQTEIKTEKKD